MCHDARAAPGRFKAVHIWRHMGRELYVAFHGHGALDRRIVAAVEACGHLRALREGFTHM
jgi:hypothetical protein